MTTVYATVPRDSSDSIARTLVEERLAACVNSVPCRSTYRWEGAVQEAEETILLAKTTEEGYDPLVARLRELHPHDVPCIERFEESDLLESFADWREGSVE